MDDIFHNIYTVVYVHAHMHAELFSKNNTRKMIDSVETCEINKTRIEDQEMMVDVCLCGVLSVMLLWCCQ